MPKKLNITSAVMIMKKKNLNCIFSKISIGIESAFLRNDYEFWQTNKVRKIEIVVHAAVEFMYSWLLCSGVCHPDLQSFLEMNLPKSTKKEKILLGVSDSKLAAAIAETSDTACMHTGVVPEIIRGNLSCDVLTQHAIYAHGMLIL